jgi:hypothetical protein
MQGRGEFRTTDTASVVTQGRRRSGFSCLRGNRNRFRVPHISLVFREMWDTAAFNPKPFDSLSTLEV